VLVSLHFNWYSPTTITGGAKLNGCRFTAATPTSLLHPNKRARISANFMGPISSWGGGSEPLHPPSAAAPDNDDKAERHGVILDGNYFFVL